MEKRKIKFELGFDVGGKITHYAIETTHPDLELIVRETAIPPLLGKLKEKGWLSTVG